VSKPGDKTKIGKNQVETTLSCIVRSRRTFCKLFELVDIAKWIEDNREYNQNEPYAVCDARRVLLKSYIHHAESYLEMLLESDELWEYLDKEIECMFRAVTDYLVLPLPPSSTIEGLVEAIGRSS
jgi:hypothetical protein